MALCETVVEAVEVASIILANQAIRVKKEEEVGRALSLRSMERVKFSTRGRNLIK